MGGNGSGAWELLNGTATAEEATQTTDQGPLIASSQALAGADAAFGKKEFLFREALAPLRNRYDHIIIDTPPALGALTVNAMVACDGILVPAQADVYSLQGIVQLGASIAAVKRLCHPNLAIWGIAITRHNARTVLSRDMEEAMEQLAAQLGTVVLQAKIRECIALREAQVWRRDIFTYAPRSNGARDYHSLVNELLERMG
jgi:chromosome partitioning protein